MIRLLLASLLVVVLPQLVHAQPGESEALSAQASADIAKNSMSAAADSCGTYRGQASGWSGVNWTIDQHGDTIASTQPVAYGEIVAYQYDYNYYTDLGHSYREEAEGWSGIGDIYYSAALQSMGTQDWEAAVGSFLSAVEKYDDAAELYEVAEGHYMDADYAGFMCDYWLEFAGY